jgi:O-antigen/teichoic acid export membrane protein
LGTETNQVRLRYSGFIVFTTQILSLITGLVFTLLLTRNMTTDQFNVWTNIFDYTGYFLLFNPVLPFWATRFVARGKEGAVKTSVSTQLTIALASTLIYFPVIVLISNAIGTSSYLPIYLIAGFYILTFYSITIFESILQCVKPQFVGYGLMGEEIVKVTIALILILGFKQLFLGAILGLVVSCVVQVFFYSYVLRSYLKQKIHWGYLKEWIKGSPAIAYNAIGGQLMSFVFILLFLYGGSGARAYYQAALTFTVIISYANSLAFALYPKLLAKSCNSHDVGVSFRTVMMLAIPFATITMIMSISFLTILKISYAVAWPVLIALTVDTLIVMVSTFYSNCVMGVEHFDAEGKIAFSKLMHSKIFKIFSIPYIQAAIAVPLAYFVLNGLPRADPVMATVEVVLILLAVHTSTLLGVYYFMRHSIKIPVAWRCMTKYVLSALLMGLVLYFLPTTTTLLSTIAKAIGGFALYIGLLLLIDHQARELLGLVWEEIRVTINQLTSKNKGFKDKKPNLITEN